MPTFVVNRKASFDYDILETYEAGIELLGLEVKSVRAGHVSLTGAFVVARSGEAVLLNATISPYQPKNTPASYDPQRSRKLLLHKSELRELIGVSSRRGLTLVPLRLYTKNSKIKLEFGVARRKKKYDQRETIKRRDIEREIRRSLWVDESRFATVNEFVDTTLQLIKPINWLNWRWRTGMTGLDGSLKIQAQVEGAWATSLKTRKQ